jgi:hypothetical protein
MSRKQTPEPPPDPVNRTAPRSEWEVDMVKAVPGNLVSDLVSDFRRGPAGPSSIAGSQSTSEPQPRVSGGTGPLWIPGARSKYWAELPEEKERAERIAQQQTLENAAIEEKFQGGKSKIQSDYDPYSRERMGLDDDD